METVLGILFLVVLVAFIVINICIASDYEKKLEEAKTKAQAMEIANKIDLAFKDMKIKELEEEINKLKKRKKSK